MAAGVTRRVLANQRRAAGRREALRARVAGERERDAASHRRPPIIEALGRLSKADRELLVLVAWDGLSYVVDAAIYEPIELRAVADDGTVMTSRFETYELLPATAANRALLSLRKQHPGATVVPDVTLEGFGPDPGKGK